MNILPVPWNILAGAVAKLGAISPVLLLIQGPVVAQRPS